MPKMDSSDIQFSLPNKYSRCKRDALGFGFCDGVYISRSYEEKLVTNSSVL